MATKSYSIKRTKHNYKEVNEFFNQQIGKSYRASTENFIEFIFNEETMKITYAIVEPYSNLTRLEIEDLKSVVGIVDKRLTKQSFRDGKVAITIDKESVDKVNIFLKSLKADNPRVSHYNNLNYSITGKPNGEWKANIDKSLEVLSIDEFIKRCEIKRDTVVGLKLKDEDKKLLVVSALKGYGAPFDLQKFKDNTLLYSKDIPKIEALKRLGLFELFEKVYKLPLTLPKINGYDGVDKGDVIQYGCAELNKSWFSNSGSRTIMSMTLSSAVTIGATEMNLIREYLKEKDMK